MRGASTEEPAAPAGKGDLTRRRILDAAAAEIARHGPAGASLGAIAAAADLRTGSLYFHFASKQRLVEAVLEEGISASLRRLDEAMVMPSGAPVDRLRAGVHAHLRALAELSDYAVVVLAPRFTDQPEQSGFRALRREYLRRWAELVADAQADGTLAAGPEPGEVRDLLLGALNAAGLAGQPPARTAEAVFALLRLPA
ncbi:TetR family transcriptional regulator [Actinomycetospora lemnae]|uniref:TetR family transcriptional regulator n=1 Tax=Actinomycetospora lemnae TaxID=3019891 RepID=A0ABT5SM76_9PSEU|nr:TetR family transcriptional regulator [Actinomycetospora sp. DW7H6]MDD7963945.1 TetR family transcriptional regulator [Actinomycetospora sp. DW7H6]